MPSGLVFFFPHSPIFLFFPYLVSFFSPPFLAKVQPNALGFRSLEAADAWPTTGFFVFLIQGPSTVLGAAQAGDLDVLDGELVVVGDFLVHADVLLGVDDDLLLRLHRDDLRVAVGLRGEKRGEDGGPARNTRFRRKGGGGFAKLSGGSPEGARGRKDLRCNCG